MNSTLEVLFTPADFSALAQRDLSDSVCVVFDILRATTSMVTALANGAEAILPVATIEEALQCRQRRPEVLLAGERDGLRIRAAQTGSIDFDLGNSPREFTTDKVAGKTIVMTTTNGTLGLKACLGAKRVFAASFLNLSIIARQLEKENPARLYLICAGTFEQAAYEDTLAAGALCELLWPNLDVSAVTDSGHMAREIYCLGAHNLSEALSRSRNARRILSRPDLHDDVAFSIRRDVYGFVTELKDGAVRKA